MTGTVGYNLLIESTPFLSNLFFITNIKSHCSDYKGKMGDFMHPNSIHYNRYINFIYSRQFRTIPKRTYTEKHHIIPRALGGKDEGNLIDLTAREHYIAHLILWKTFKGKMAQAFWLLNRGKKNSLCSRQYSLLRIENSIQVSFDKKGVPFTKAHKEHIGRALKGRIFSEKTKHKMSLSSNQNGKKNSMYGKTQSAKTKEKIREKATGRKVSEETRSKLSVIHTGRLKSKETCEKLSKALKGRSWEDIYGIEKAKEMKEKMSKRQTGKKLSKQHSNNIKEGKRRRKNEQR